MPPRVATISETFVYVTLHSARLRCPTRLRPLALVRLLALRRSRKQWTQKLWTRAVQQLAQDDCWGVSAHGGARSRARRIPGISEQSTEVCLPSAAVTCVGTSGNRAQVLYDMEVESAHDQAPNAANAAAVAATVDRSPHGDQIKEATPSSRCQPLAAKRFSGPLLRFPRVRREDIKTLGLLGQGSFAKVFEIEAGGCTFAVKKISHELRREVYRVPLEVKREFDILDDVRNQHPNVISLLARHSSRRRTLLFFEKFPYSLRGLLRTRSNSEPGLQPNVVRDLGEGLCAACRFIHSRRILHRDIKPDNCLARVDPWVAVLADFGSSRRSATEDCAAHDLSTDVFTLWYRPPEVLLGSSCYETSADIWSLGCLLAELAQGRPFFQGASAIGMLFSIFRVFGTPSLQAQPELATLPHFRRSVFPLWSDQGNEAFGAAFGAKSVGEFFGPPFRELVVGILRLAPASRDSASHSLGRGFFLKAGC